MLAFARSFGVIIFPWSHAADDNNTSGCNQCVDVWKNAGEKEFRVTRKLSSHSAFSATRRGFQFQFLQLFGWLVNRERFLWHFAWDNVSIPFPAAPVKVSAVFGVESAHYLLRSTLRDSFQLTYRSFHLSISLPKVKLITVDLFSCNFAVPFADGK